MEYANLSRAYTRFIKEVNLFPKNRIFFCITSILFIFLRYAIFYITVSD
jgi:hypothetical protein